jgi:hypothetical protein
MLSPAAQPFESRYEHSSIGYVLLLMSQQETDVSSADLVGGRKTDGAWKASLCGPYIVSRHGPRNAHMRRNAVAPKTGQMRQARVRFAQLLTNWRVRCEHFHIRGDLPIYGRAREQPHEAWGFAP